MFVHFKGYGGEWRRRFAREEDREHGRHRFSRDGGFGEGRGRGRFFEQGQLRLVILALIAEAPRHGYELIKAIEDRLGGGYSPSPGVIYPTLTLLGELGYAAVSEVEAGRKLYSITPAGELHLSENKAMVDAVFERMRRTSAAAGRPPQVARAIENLKMAMRLRLARGALSVSEAEAIAEALDQAARQIEKV